MYEQVSHSPLVARNEPPARMSLSRRHMLLVVQGQMRI